MDKKVQQVAVSEISITGGTQSRALMNQSIVKQYAADMNEGATFPPIVVFQDVEACWLADGFHRLAAWKLAKPDALTIAAIVRHGTQRDALLHSVGANATHGLRRSKEDKRRAVAILLADPEWMQWTDQVLARHAKVCGVFVAKQRLILGIEKPALRRDAIGRLRDTSNMGRGGNHAHRKLASIVSALDQLDARLDEYSDLRAAQTLLRQAGRLVISAMERAGMIQPSASASALSTNDESHGRAS